MTTLLPMIRAAACALLLCGCAAVPIAPQPATDAVAEAMLLLQTSSGGWSKHYREAKVDYTRNFDAAERAALQAPDRHDDATIDNQATTSEIVYLAQAHARTGNPAYLAAAGRGIDYLLAAQYPNGGWPQFHPDRSSYRHQVTLNDDAMVRVITLLQDVAEGRDALAALAPTHGARAAAAATRGIDMLLRLQVVLQDRPTIWAAQYDEISLRPAKARAYELPALAVAESVGVLRLLMRQPRPDARIVWAVSTATTWLQVHRLDGLALERIDTGTPPRKDVRVVPQPGAVLWARFHDLDRQEPLFANRDSQPVTFEQLPQERRAGYAWYGTWPMQLLDKELPRWRARHGLN